MASLLFMVSAVVSVADGSRVSSPPPMPCLHDLHDEFPPLHVLLFPWRGTEIGGVSSHARSLASVALSNRIGIARGRAPHLLPSLTPSCLPCMTSLEYGNPELLLPCFVMQNRFGPILPRDERSTHSLAHRFLGLSGSSLPPGKEGASPHLPLMCFPGVE